MQAQNALSGVVSGRDAIKKRWGMTGYNASSFSGPVLSIHTLPFPGFPDPVPPTPSGYYVWPGGARQFAFVGPTYEPPTSFGTYLRTANGPMVQKSAGVYQFINAPGNDNDISLDTIDTSDGSTASLSTASGLGETNWGIYYGKDGVEQMYVQKSYRIGDSGWTVFLYDAQTGARTPLGTLGELDTLNLPRQANQVGVVKTASGGIYGMMCYGVHAISWNGVEWVMGTDLQAGPLAGYAGGGDGQFFSTYAPSNNRLILSVYDNSLIADPGLMLFSDDFGASWTIAKTGTVGNGFIDVVYSSVDNNWVVAVEQTATTWDILFSTDNGDTWTTVKQIDVSGSPYFYGTRAYGQTTGSYTGAWIDASNNVEIFEIDSSGTYTVKDTFSASSWPVGVVYGWVLVPAP
jgi:hypothetical protein